MGIRQHRVWSGAFRDCDQEFFTSAEVWKWLDGKFAALGDGERAVFMVEFCNELVCAACFDRVLWEACCESPAAFSMWSRMSCPALGERMREMGATE